MSTPTAAEWQAAIDTGVTYGDAWREFIETYGDRMESDILSALSQIAGTAVSETVTNEDGIYAHTFTWGAPEKST